MTIEVGRSYERWGGAMRVPELRAFWGEIGWVPTDAQRGVAEGDERFGLLSGGERGGKSEVTAVGKGVSRSLRNPGGLYWVVGPDYEQCKPEFDRMHEVFQGMGAVQSVSMPQDGSRVMRLRDGSLFQTKTSAEVERLASVAPDGVMMVEAAQQTLQAYRKLRSRVAQRRGYVFASGTLRPPKARAVHRWFAQMWKGWQRENKDGGVSWSLPTWSNTVVFPGGRDDPEIRLLEKALPRDEFAERHGGEPVQLSGVVMREYSPDCHVRYRFEGAESSFQEFYDEELIRGIWDERALADSWRAWGKTGRAPRGARIPAISGDLRVPVQLWVDPGYGHFYAVMAVQVIGKEVWLIDEVFHRGRYTEEIIDECASREWWPNVSTVVIDFYGGSQHHNAPAEIERWQRYATSEYDKRLSLNAMPVPVDPGYSRHNGALHATHIYEREGIEVEPRLYIDPKCVSLIGGVVDGEEWPGEYEIHVYPTDSGGAVTREKPRDINNDAIKAVNYGLWWNFGPVERRRRDENGFVLPMPRRKLRIG